MNPHSPQEKSFTNVEQLRASHNERFVRLAYQFILGRKAEPEGLQHYLALFRQNFSQAEFLSELRTSPEFKSRWEASKFHSKEDIKNKDPITDSAMPFHSLQFSDELKELTQHARSIYFHLKAAAVSHLVRKE